MELRQSIEELIYRSSMALDARDFNGFLNLCDPAFEYAITTYSPEIRKDLTWLEHDHAGMKTLFANLPKHNSDQSLLTRHVTVCLTEVQEDGATVKVTSALQVFRTTQDGGTTELFAVGKMLDVVRLVDSAPLLLKRNVRLDTRMLGFGTHLPF